MRNLPGMMKFFEAEGKGSAPAKETFENVTTASTEDVTAVLHFDPFKKGDTIPEGKATDAKPSGEAKEAKTEAGDEKGKSNLPSAKEDKSSTSTKPATEAQPADEAGSEGR